MDQCIKYDERAAGETTDPNDPNYRTINDQFKNTINGLSVDLHQIVIGFKPEDKQNPTYFYLNSNEEYALNIESRLSTKKILRNVQINDDDIDFYGNYLVKSYSEVDESITVRNPRESSTKTNQCKNQNTTDIDTGLYASRCSAFLDMKIYSGNRILTVNRDYPFLIDTLGDLGGFFDLVILVSILIFGFCTSRSYEKDMRRSILLKSARKYNLSMPNLTRGEVVSLMDDVLEDAQDGISFFKKMIKNEVLEKVIFKKHHEVLLPLALMLEKKIEQESEISEEQLLEYEAEHPSIFEVNHDEEQEHIKGYNVERKVHLFRKIDQDEKDKKQQEEDDELEEIEIEEAFDRLKKEVPETSLGVALNKYLIEILEKGMDLKKKEDNKEIVREPVELQNIKNDVESDGFEGLRVDDFDVANEFGRDLDEIDVGIGEKPEVAFKKSDH